MRKRNLSKRDADHANKTAAHVATKMLRTMPDMDTATVNQLSLSANN
jgi:hypothetical protein